MRTRKAKIGICFVVSIMAAGLLGTAMAQVYTDPVGFVKVDAVRNGLTMISVPLTAADNALYGAEGCVGDQIKENLTGGAGAAFADVIWKWDLGTQSYVTAFLIADWGAPYDGNWWDEGAGDYSTLTFDAGEACWIMRRDNDPELATITFLGWVPMGETTTLTLVKGLSMFNWPYPTTLALNDSTLGAAGTGGAGAAFADVVWQWEAATQGYTTAFLIDTWGVPYDGQWWDEATGDYSTIQFAPGAGFWYMRRPDASAVWVCTRPY
ncbi:hypothetical protein HQ563_11235 [bacterium]|nr:hypothetical protein [bacterium]